MSNNNRYVRLSKIMSVALRHDPDSFGIELDEEGWVDVDKLLDALRKHKRWEGITEEDFHTVMSVSDKKRFEISDGHIRALYGHSIPMKIVKEPTTLPRCSITVPPVGIWILFSKRVFFPCHASMCTCRKTWKRQRKWGVEKRRTL